GGGGCRGVDEPAGLVGDGDPDAVPAAVDSADLYGQVLAGEDEVRHVGAQLDGVGRAHDDVAGGEYPVELVQCCPVGLQVAVLVGYPAQGRAVHGHVGAAGRDNGHGRVTVQVLVPVAVAEGDFAVVEPGGGGGG